MYIVSKTTEIHAAHKLSLPYESKCVCLHGHSYKITVWCASNTLNSENMVLDYNVIKGAVNRFDHTYLNDEIPSDWGNTTTEMLCHYLAKSIPFTIKVEAWESSNNRCIYINEMHPEFDTLKYMLGGLN